jgi:hypothetical protein
MPDAKFNVVIRKLAIVSSPNIEGLLGSNIANTSAEDRNLLVKGKLSLFIQSTLRRLSLREISL